MKDILQQNASNRADLVEARNLLKWLNSCASGGGYKREVSVEAVQDCERAIAGLIAEVENAKEWRTDAEQRLAYAAEEIAALNAELSRLQGLSAAGAEGKCVCNLKDKFPARGAPKPPCDGFFGTSDTCLNPDCGHARACHASGEVRE
jgi:hypothetical protein